MILWRQIQKQNFTRLADLAAFLQWTEPQRAQFIERPRFALNLPRRLAEKIAKSTLDDPLLRQFVPSKLELNSASQEAQDPVGDLCSQKSAKLLHKYEGRALLVATSACAMHCRYCFRQNFPYETQKAAFDTELKCLSEDTSIHECILSGGDPLSLSNDTLQALMKSLDQIPHIKRIRFHTRFPIGIPERLDMGFLEILAKSSKQIFFVIHSNHARELDADILTSLANVKRLGIPLLCQSVLLKGVNDDECTLLTLCKTLIDQGILPYYLHLLDPVSGSAHFDVPLERGRELIAHLQAHLSGYGVPRLVREIAGEPSKTFM